METDFDDIIKKLKMLPTEDYLVEQTENLLGIVRCFKDKTVIEESTKNKLKSAFSEMMDILFQDVSSKRFEHKGVQVGRGMRTGKCDFGVERGKKKDGHCNNKGIICHSGYMVCETHYKVLRTDFPPCDIEPIDNYFPPGSDQNEGLRRERERHKQEELCVGIVRQGLNQNNICNSRGSIGMNDEYKVCKRHYKHRDN